MTQEAKIIDLSSSKEDLLRQKEKAAIDMAVSNGHMNPHEDPNHRIHYRFSVSRMSQR